MKNLRRNLSFPIKKKANMVLDGMTLFITLFIFAIVGLFAYKMFADIEQELVTDDFLSDEAEASLTSFFTKFPAWLDSVFIMALVLFWILILGLSFVSDAHPIFWGLTLILMIFLIFVGAVLANTYYDISTDDDMIEYRNNLPKTTWALDRLPYVLIVMLFSVGFVLFGVRQR